MVDTFRLMRDYFASGATRSYEFRLEQLKKLENFLHQEKSQIVEALRKDLGKPETESLVAEWAFTLDEIHFAKKNLRAWMKKRYQRTPLSLWPGRSYVQHEPLGLVLVMSPWNYPFQLLMAPLIGAIAGGNCVVLKPSELAVQTAQLIAKLIPQYFDARYVQVVEGSVPETTELLKQRFDHIFFTGSGAVGAIVAQAAARHLTPVTLELGGKSPTIICADANLPVAARRLVWGKFYNAGQTCVAPDYVYVEDSIYEKFKALIAIELKEQFGEKPFESSSYGRIINKRNLQRLEKMIERPKVIGGGDVREVDLYIAPTVLDQVTWQDAVMQEEIFGPLLPLLKFENLNSVFQEIKSREKPLAAYFFSGDKRKQEQFVAEISAGGITINDAFLHLASPYLPFGGVGGSGYGRYHGEYSFQTFSHLKSVLVKSTLFDLRARYAPYTEKKLRILRIIFRF
jgi:aldehyde dehydrogenase (NAD+)